MGRLAFSTVLAFVCAAAVAGAQDAAQPDAAPGDMVKNYLFRLSDEAFARRQAKGENGSFKGPQRSEFSQLSHGIDSRTLGRLGEL